MYQQNTKYLGDTNPADGDYHAQADYSDDPVCLVIIRAKEAEDQVENDSTNITGRTRQSGNDTVVRRVYMWYHREVRAVTGLSEYCCDGCRSDESMDVDIRDRSDADQHDSLRCSTLRLADLMEGIVQKSIQYFLPSTPARG